MLKLRQILPRSLFGRSLMIIVMPVLLLQLVVTFVFFDRHWDTMTDKLILALSGEVARIVKDIHMAQEEGEVENIISEAKGVFGLSVSMQDVEGHVAVPVSHSLPLFLRDSIIDRLEHALRHMLPEKIKVPRSYEGPYEIIVFLDDKSLISFSVPEKRLSSTTTYVFILLMISSAVLLIAIAVVFMRNQVRPIRRLALAAERIGKGQEVSALRFEGAIEVRQATQAFMDMQARIRRQIEQRTTMLAGVSHDLKTPLTRMRLQLAMAKDTPENEYLLKDISEMEKMIEGYLSFAKGSMSEKAEMVDMRVILERIVENARRQGLSIQEQFSGGRMMIKLKPIAIERAISNVVHNAGKFGTHLWVTAQEKRSAFEVIIDDDGPGIPEDQFEDVFRPFYRVEKSRNKKTGGIGLGLSIVQDIVHEHGGSVRLQGSEKGGLQVMMRFPL